MHRWLLESMILHNAVRFFRKLFSVQKSSGNSSLDLLQSAINYRFSDSALLKQALTHKSGVGHEDRMGLLSNERMEFLGDAVLNCLVTEHLYRLYPEKPEGQLSKVKSLVVSRKILGMLALTIDLGKYLIFGNSEKKTGGVQRNSIVSNAFEAMIGAIYLDGGLDAARHFLQRYLFCRIDDFVSDSDNVNYKSRILELSQRDGFGFPKYTVVSASGRIMPKNLTFISK